jgi:transposase
MFGVVMSCLIVMSQKELHRLENIRQVRQGSLTVIRAAELLGLSRSQVHRLLQAYDLNGIDGLVSKKRGRPSNRRHSEDFRRHAAMLKAANRFRLPGRTAKPAKHC